MTNQLCIGRKCQLTYYMTVHGVGGHAGNDFLIGKNAINETALKLAKIIKLTDVDKGTTVTPATIKGGIHVCSIPDECETAIDIRIDSEAEHDRIVKQMAQIMAHTFIPGTQTTYHLDMAQFKPYTETPAISAFHAFICHTAEQLGLPPFGKIHSGGAADSGNIAYAGVPVLCGCGIMVFGSTLISSSVGPGCARDASSAVRRLCSSCSSLIKRASLSVFSSSNALKRNITRARLSGE